MEITVIIPAYNSQEVLMDAVHSVLEQSYVHMICEIIIINDGSKDQTLSIMKNIKDNVQTIPIILIDKENGGASSARNAGMKIARGKWIALLDADDEWLPNKLEVQIKTIQMHPHIDFLGCQHNNQKLQILLKRINSLYKVKIKDLCLKSFPVTPAIIFKRELLDTIGYFDETQLYCEDSNFCFRACEKCNFYQLTDSLVKTGHGKPSIGASGLSANIKGMNQGFLKNIREVYQDGYISLPFYCFIRIFNFAKYVRRILISRLKNIK